MPMPEWGFGLLAAVVQRRLDEQLPEDIEDRATQVLWALMPFRDLIEDLYGEIDSLKEASN